MIPTVGEDVKKDFFSGHATSVAIGKGEVQDLRERPRRECRGIVQVPGIRLLHIASELVERWCCLRIRSIEGSCLATEVGPEDPVDDVDMVERADASMKLVGAFRRQRNQ